MNLCKCLNTEYKKKSDEISDFVSEYSKRLSRPIKDLDDIREAMKSLDQIKLNFTTFDFLLGFTESLLIPHHLTFFLTRSNRRSLRLTTKI